MVQGPYTLSLASRDGGKRSRSETAKKGMSGDRSIKSWEVRRGYRCSSRAVRRPRACSSDGGTWGERAQEWMLVLETLIFLEITCPPPLLVSLVH